MTNPFEVLNVAKQAVEPLYTRAIALGYNVTANMSFDDTGNQPHVWFVVWRFDQSSDFARTFDTTDAVSGYLDHVQTLPIYCLELVGNPRIESVVETYRPEAAAVWITDTESGEKFGVRFNDLEAVTRLCVHAESTPAIGNWEPAPVGSN
jgi:hypothetical protein